MNTSNINEYPAEVMNLQMENLHLKGIVDSQNKALIRRDLEIQQIKGKLNEVRCVVPAYLYKDEASKYIYINYKEGKRIGFFCNCSIVNAYYHKFDEGFDREDEIVFTVIVANSMERKVEIAISKFNPKNVVTQFQRQAGVTFTNSFSNSFLGQAFFNFISGQVQDAPTLSIKFFGGWDFDEKNKMYFRVSTVNKQLIKASEVSELDRDEAKKCIHEYFDAVSIFDHQTNVFLLLWIFNGLLFSVLELFNCTVNHVALLSGSNIPLNQIITELMQVYNRDTKLPLTLSSGLDNVINHCYSAKDEVIIAIDDLQNEKEREVMVSKIVPSYTKQVPLIKKLPSIQKETRFTPLNNMLIISESIAYTSFTTDMLYLPLDKIPFNEEKFNNIQFNNQVIKRFMYLFIKFVEKNMDKILHIISTKSKEYFHMYEETFNVFITRKTFVSLLITADILEEYCRYYDSSFRGHFEDDRELEVFLYEIIRFSENWENLDGICQLFKEKFLNLLSLNRLNLIDANTGTCLSEYNETKPTIFFSGDKLFITLNSLREIIEETFPIRIPPLHVLKALQREGWLLTHNNSYETKPIITYPGNYTVRRSMVTIRKEFFNELGVVLPF